MKEQIELLKKKRKAQGQGFIRNKDIIQEKLKLNKEEQLFKIYESDNDHKEDKNKKKEEKEVNEEKEDQSIPTKKQKISETEIKTIQKENIEDKSKEEENENDDEGISNHLKTKEDYPVSINPAEIIKEEKDNDTIKRVVYPEEYPYDFKCEQLYNWLHQTFIEWEKELEESIFSSPDEIKTKMGIYRQCRGYIKTLLINLKERKVTKTILDKLFQVMVFLIDRDYIRAHDSYIELSIGNAPFPMGLTMVGIHERSGRSRIYTSQIAYILNDDITKKYLQSVKRVMTFIQRRYPQCPSKCVFS